MKNLWVSKIFLATKNSVFCFFYIKICLFYHNPLSALTLPTCTILTHSMNLPKICGKNLASVPSSPRTVLGTARYQDIHGSSLLGARKRAPFLHKDYSRLAICINNTKTRPQ
jgi:hypothetical protein